MPAHLVLTAAPVVTVQQLNSLLQAQGLSPADPVAVATASGSLPAGALSAGAYDTAISVASGPGHHTVELLGKLAATLRPGGRLIVQEVGGCRGRWAGSRVGGRSGAVQCWAAALMLGSMFQRWELQSRQVF